MYLKILDILVSVGIIVSLFLAGRHRIGWLCYAISCVGFIIVVAAKGLWGMAFMGVVLIIIAINNYWRGTEKEEQEPDIYTARFFVKVKPDISEDKD